MIKNILISVMQLVLLLLLQVFLLDNVNLFGFINPMVYVWFIILLPFSTPKWLVLIASFIMGMSVDVFSADIGINAAACVLVGFLRPILINAFSGNIDNMFMQRPSVSSLGFANYLKYIVSLVFIHHLVYFFVSAFSWSETGQVLIRVVLSSVVTVALILLLDLIFYRKNE